MRRVSVRLHNRKGAILVLAALSIVTLVIALAVAIDISRLYEQRNELQTGADAAALAGGVELTLDSVHIADSAVAFANRNSVLNNTVVLSATDVECGIWDTTSRTYSTTVAAQRCGNATNAVKVIRRDSSHYLFPQILSASRSQITTQAVAWVTSSISGTNCVKPFAVQDTVLFDRLNPFRTSPRVGFTLDTMDYRILKTNASSLTFCVKDGSTGSGNCPGGTNPGNFNPIQLPPGDNGGNAYGNNIANLCTSATPEITVGQALSVETGNIVGQTKKGIDTWCAQFTGDCSIKLVLWHDTAYPATASDGSACKQQSVGGAWCVQVSMVAGAVLTSVNGKGNQQGMLTGYFTLMNDPGGQVGGSPGLLRRVILVK